MKRLLNTLYVTTEGAYVRKDGESALVEVQGTERLRVPLHLLGSILCFGRSGLSSAMIGACAERGISIAFLSEAGRFLARVEGPVSGNVLLRREQYRRADAPIECSAIVATIVAAKAQNQRTVLKRALRDHGGSIEADGREKLEAAQRRLGQIARIVLDLEDTDRWRILIEFEGWRERRRMSTSPYSP